MATPRTEAEIAALLQMLSAQETQSPLMKELPVEIAPQKSPIEMVEAAIGFPPGTRLDLSFVISQRRNLQSWLMLRGISFRGASKAQAESLVNAYASERYFQTWLASDQKKNKQKNISGLDWGSSDNALGLSAKISTAEEQYHAFCRAIEAAKKIEAIEIARVEGISDDGSVPALKAARDYVEDIIGSRMSEVPAFPEWLAQIKALKRSGIDAPPAPQSEDKVELTKYQTANAADEVISSKLTALEQKLSTELDAKLRTSKLELSDAAKTEMRALITSTTKDVLANLLPQQIEIKRPSGEIIPMGLQHECFPKLLRAFSARNHRNQRMNIWLTGPTGSGKTSACEAGAKALGLPFGFDSSLDTDYKVNGFTDANGNVVGTEFIRIYRDGGVYVADEIDNWLASALIALNAPLANGYMSTPGGIIQRHPDCIIVACANTWGLGATNDYVGRSKLDAASLDRFRPKIDWPYDEKMEMAIARQKQGEEWCLMVQRLRRAAKAQGLQIIISPRATFDGIGLLEAGFPWKEVVEMCITAGLKPEQIKALGSTSIQSHYNDLAAD